MIAKLIDCGKHSKSPTGYLYVYQTNKGKNAFFTTYQGFYTLLRGWI